MDYNYDALSPILHRGEELPLPLSDEHRSYLMGRGQDILVKNADDRVAAHEHRERMLAESGDNGSNEPGVVVDEEDDYNEWSVDELKTEIDERNKEADREVPLSKSGNKSELVSRLEQDDAASADAE